MNRSSPTRNPGGFTLIELLIVVAIIAILAAIAVPNLLEAQVRSKVSRVKADMRSLKTAIEAYFVDANDFPFRRSLDSANMRQVPDSRTRQQQMSVLTTPVAYISALPADVFESRIPPTNNLIDYYDPVQTAWLINARFLLSDPRRVKPGAAGYLIVSVGPDGYLDATQGTLNGWPQNEDTRGKIYSIYDPTNGSVSVGNIYDGPHGQDGTPSFLMRAWNNGFPQ